MTTLARAARALCRHGDESCWETHTDEARALVTAIRVPDMNIALAVARKIGVPASTVDLCWTHMIDAILKDPT